MLEADVCLSPVTTKLWILISREDKALERKALGAQPLVQ
jgi:hypothetical protein